MANSWKKVEEEREEPKPDKLPPCLKSTMSARNLFFGKDLLSQISEFYHELKRMAVESKTPIEEEAEKEVNNIAESPQQDTFPKDARANPPTPQRFPSPRGIKNGKERAVLQEGCSNVSAAGDSGGITIDLFWFLKPCSYLYCLFYGICVAQLHAQLLITGSLSHSPPTTCLLKCLTEVSSTPHYYFLGFFSRILDPSTFQWNTIIWAYSSCHFPQESLNLFRSTLEGQMVHAMFVKHFPDCDAFVVNSLVYMGLVKSRFVDDARKLFNEMPVRKVVSWTSLIADHAKDGRASEAIRVFKEMMFENVEPDTIAMVAVLSACVQLQDLKLGKCLHQIVIDKRIGVNNNLAVALINMYVKGGSIKSARHIFDSMNNKITPAWNAIIDGYCKIDNIDITRSLFEKMNAPDIISFNSMITRYIHGGRLKEAL
ncbi:pentatricopeptide repeat-containing protein At2g29760, chloroplastic-like [Zingiber officinale]|uniref:pentatricopeptide repeat-containing protein At2g29760, chloroplastic-like n=1 Tax=Zingiber officinale TaxID=94328 RepID=UPI001C4B2061|nr:pentatricopeptide repeat-containing protein At2g29760, chloroplastic-like [Zingiber officinale]